MGSRNNQSVDKRISIDFSNSQNLDILSKPREIRKGITERILTRKVKIILQQ
jgi:hypothetical protein